MSGTQQTWSVAGWVAHNSGANNVVNLGTTITGLANEVVDNIRLTGSTTINAGTITAVYA